MNYFEYYGIPVSFLPDEVELRKKYLIKSREVHPDFFTDASDIEKERALEESGYNNKAYQILNNFDSRMEYILQLYGVKTEGDQANLDPEFLMEMMELNENIMELQTANDENGLQNLTNAVKAMEQNLLDSINISLHEFSENAENKEHALEVVKDYYLKNKYLLRIKENISKFASRFD